MLDGAEHALGGRGEDALDLGRSAGLDAVEGDVVGFVGSGPARDDDAPRARELYFIYLLDAWHGTGIGQRLFDAAVDDGEPLYLWVAEGNPRAHRFYVRNGFVAKRFVQGL